MNPPEAPRKRSLLLKIALVLAALVLVFIGVVATRPSNFSVSRSTTISAPAPVVFGHVNELRKWDAWSPWAKLDPNSKITFDGPPAGKGSVMSWVGNNQVGEGRMTITESRPDELIRMELEFFKPMAGKSDTEFTFKPEGRQTLVTWTMSGEHNFVGKAMCLVMNGQKMMAEQFDKGLASMKAVAETAAK